MSSLYLILLFFNITVNSHNAEPPMMINMGTRSAKVLCEPKEFLSVATAPCTIFKMFINNEIIENIVSPRLYLVKLIPNQMTIDKTTN